MSGQTMDEVLAHHGVKGMKWGKHKQRQLDSLNRIAAGKGKFGETIKFHMNVPILELALNQNNLAKVAAGRAAVLQMQKDRIQSGKATKLDKLDRALNTPLSALLRGN